MIPDPNSDPNSISTIFSTQNDKIENEKSLTKCIRFEQTFSIKFILTSIYITFVHYSLYARAMNTDYSTHTEHSYNFFSID